MQPLTKPTASAGNKRRAARVRSRFQVVVEYQGRHVTARVFDISETGLGLDVQEAFFPPTGVQVVVRCSELGAVEGTIRWIRGNRMGIAFGAYSNAKAQVQSYFKFSHPQISKSVLTR